MNKNKCFGICKETERLENAIDTLENKNEELKNQLKLFRTAYLLTINELLPDIDCDSCKYKNKKYCDDHDCHKAIHRYFLNKAKE